MASTAKVCRIPFAEACRRLGVGYSKLDLMCASGVFSVQKDGTSKTSPKYLLEDEVDIYIEENNKGPGRGEMAVHEYRLKKKRIKR